MLNAVSLPLFLKLGWPWIWHHKRKYLQDFSPKRSDALVLRCSRIQRTRRVWANLTFRRGRIQTVFHTDLVLLCKNRAGDMEAGSPLLLPSSQEQLFIYLSYSGVPCKLPHAEGILLKTKVYKLQMEVISMLYLDLTGLKGPFCSCLVGRYSKEHRPLISWPVEVYYNITFLIWGIVSSF